MAKGLHKNNQIVIFSKSETKTGMKIKLFFCLIAGIVLANTATAQLGGLLKKKKDKEEVAKSDDDSSDKADKKERTIKKNKKKKDKADKAETKVA